MWHPPSVHARRRPLGLSLPQSPGAGRLRGRPTRQPRTFAIGRRPGGEVAVQRERRGNRRPFRVPCGSEMAIVHVRRATLVALDPPIADRDDATGIGCHVCIVRDENDRDALAIEFLKHAEDFDARMRIEIARGLVGEHQRGVIDQGPSDGHALLLAARHLRRLVAGAIREPDAVQEPLRSLSRLPPAWPACA